MKPAEVDRIFAKLRMKVRDGKDKHAWFMYNGKVVLHTMRSHGRKDLGRIAHFIRQQLRVSEDQFAGLRDCPLKLEDYVAILKQKGIIPHD